MLQGNPGFVMMHTIKRLFYFSVLVLAVISSVAHGDGKFFYREKVPVGVPYQRAVLMFENGKETLILQSKYKTAMAEGENSIAWVVPVPAVPELASMDAEEAKSMFFLLGFHSRPSVFPIMQIAMSLSIVALISFLFMRALIWLFTKRCKREAKPLAMGTIRIIIGLIIGLLLLSILMPSLGIKGVDVLKAETVGIYDVKVIRGDDAGAVTGWLKDNGFGFEERDSKVFDQYVKKGWCFVTAKINKEVDPGSKEAVSEGLAAPLILRFDSKEAIYPMALTGTTGENTEVLLYTFSDHKMECEERLKLAFFGETRGSFLKTEPDEFFHDAKTKLWQMCKFKGTLNPNQMEEDIVFKQAKDDKPYREIRWH